MRKKEGDKVIRIHSLMTSRKCNGCTNFTDLYGWHVYAKQFVFKEGYKKCVDLLHVNIRSIRKHWNEFLLHLSEKPEQTDVIALTEMNADEPTCET